MNKKNISLIFFFCTFIGIMPFLFLFSSKQSYSIYEKRILSSFPKVSVKAVLDGTFEKGLETYLSDYFGGRTFFLGVNAYSNLLIGRNGANGIYRGKEGYLMEKPTEGGLQKMCKNMTYISNFASKNKCDINLMLVPTTGFILKDKLPILEHNLFAQMYFDEEAICNIKEHSADYFDFIDLTEPFQQNKEKQLYYKTDHHWTSQGAYLAYVAYCNKVSLNPHPIQHYDIQSYEGFYGTAYGRSCFWLNEPDCIELWKSKNKNDIWYQISDNKTENNPLFFTDYLKSDDKYNVFLGGNHVYTKICNSDVREGKLLIIKDSFANPLVPFLAEHYSEIYLVDLRYYKKKISDIISEKQIDSILILYGMNNFAKDGNLVWLK